MLTNNGKILAKMNFNFAALLLDFDAPVLVCVHHDFNIFQWYMIALYESEPVHCAIFNTVQWNDNNEIEIKCKRETKNKIH